MAKNNNKAAPIVVNVDMPIAKTTKNTFRFDADSAENTPISSLYIAKFAFGKGASPKVVKKITVEWE